MKANKSTPEYWDTVSAALHNVLYGSIFTDAFSQNKLELVLRFDLTMGSELFLVIDCQPKIGLIGFPTSYTKSKKNVVTCFDALLGSCVRSVYHVPDDRIFAIHFDIGKTLYFQMFGPMSNVLLLDANGMVLDMFHHVKKKSDCVDLKTLKPSLIQVESVFDFLNEENRAFQQLRKQIGIEVRKSTLLRILEKEIIKLQRAIPKIKQRLFDLDRPSAYEKWGHLLLMYQHTLAKIHNGSTLTLKDYESSETISVPTIAGKSTSEIASRYFGKAKNETKEKFALNTKIQQMQDKIMLLEGWQNQLKGGVDIDQVETGMKKFGLVKNVRIKSIEIHKPYWDFEFLGFEIWIGKSAKDNDALTFKCSHKNDLWLHARDVSGSHVIIRHKSGSNVPKPVLEKAASWAAYFSKRKTDSLAPVIVTTRKHVHKLKGFAAGMIKVDKEELVILVKPENPKNI